ncbi:MAG: helix-turn-helix domain-containing protein [Firmicutes bacterium]|nr:helix-turn-helix domain-containing protein [Bacillota bacterium]
MDLNKIGAFITETRKAKGLTQSELADKLHVTDRAVSKWECGKGLPDSSLMLRLGDVLGISVTELLCGEKVSSTDAIARSEENAVELLKEIENARHYGELSDDEKKALENEYKNTTSAKKWKAMNLLSFIQSAFWIALFLLSTFLGWHEIATAMLLVMMVLNATVPIIILLVRMGQFSMWLNLRKNIKERKLD